MYESPLEIVITEMGVEIAKEIDKEVMTAVRNCSVQVNKEELIKALAYDRNQYEKGYEDGIKDFVERLIHEAKEMVGE